MTEAARKKTPLKKMHPLAGQNVPWFQELSFSLVTERSETAADCSCEPISQKQPTSDTEFGRMKPVSSCCQAGLIQPDRSRVVTAHKLSRCFDCGSQFRCLLGRV